MSHASLLAADDYCSYFFNRQPVPSEKDRAKACNLFFLVKHAHNPDEARQEVGQLQKNNNRTETNPMRERMLARRSSWQTAVKRSRSLINKLKAGD